VVAGVHYDPSVLGRVSQQLLTLLQLTRMALVFTAISNGLAALLLRTRVEGFDLTQRHVTATLAVAVGLYGFGMALNDIIDRRRDRQLARGRPLPSGRIGLGLAITVAGVLLALALAGGWMFWKAPSPGDPAGLVSLLLVLVTAGLIATYDAAGKYLVWVGLVLLGLVRFFHAAVPGPELPVAWHALFLLNHVTIVSAVAYRWEAKRPPMTRRESLMVAAGLVAMNLVLVSALFLRRGSGFAESLAFEWVLLLPVISAVAFAGLAAWIKHRANDRRAAGKSLILYGLLWLIVYDALFVAGYVDLLLGLALMIFWPVSYLAVRTMRVWANVTDLARKPQYLRAE
jgi:4-hydroxybenzoate polyprenyltransferase